MELANIEKLLEKYLEATTTVAEEQTLKQYFMQEEVAPHLQEYQPMFRYFSTAGEERSTRQGPLKTKKNTWYLQWISVAAVAVLFFGVYFGSMLTEKDKGTVENPEMAYYETKKALNLIAQNLNKGTEKMAYLNEYEATKNKIFNNN
ncbi:MAG: hypothetical protein KDD04_12200 [Sinomicrobium sp.]|nr:hypothetical protein [Sinomicrobium sp.]